MLETTQRDELHRMVGQVHQLMNQFAQSTFGAFMPVESWSPAINLYRLPRSVEVCVDLAGVDPRTLDLRIEPGRLAIRGVRNAPEPHRHPGETMRILAMEIDHGPFCRVVPLPEQVDVSRVVTEYHKGLLWVRLPIRDEG